MIIDLSLRSGHGIDLIEQIKAKDDQIKMLVASMYDESLFAERVLRAGASAILANRNPSEKIVEAIRQAVRGEFSLSPRMANRLLHSVVGGEPLGQDPIEPLQPRNPGLRHDRPGHEHQADRREAAPQPQDD